MSPATLSPVRSLSKRNRFVLYHMLIDEAKTMQNSYPLTRRDFVSSASLLAIGLALFPKSEQKPANKDNYVIINGWVLKASEVA
jgi:hypothetical protein